MVPLLLAEERTEDADGHDEDQRDDRRDDDHDEDLLCDESFVGRQLFPPHRRLLAARIDPFANFDVHRADRTMLVRFALIAHLHAETMESLREMPSRGDDRAIQSIDAEVALLVAIDDTIGEIAVRSAITILARHSRNDE